MSAIQQILAATGGASAPLDPDAQAFITAAGITDPTQKTAINDLVVTLKADSLWTLFDVIYPIVGGTASTHKWNLINPVDSDVAHRATFVGGLTHSANGILPNGSTGYINSHYEPSTYATNLDTHISYYSRTDLLAGAEFDFGAADAGSTTYLQYICRTSVLGGSQTLSDSYNARANGTVTDSLGLFTQSVLTALGGKTFQNDTLVGTGPGISNDITSITVPITFCARNSNGVVDSFAARQCAFLSIGKGLDNAAMVSFAAAVTAFQTTLGRNV